ncbi:uncharacterized protein [Pyxicephalus adspersus]|uniref:uncharacterized protein n=1 Tax=Pyxicephalus adspersus TaxID=30357 RepID=UPI003B5960C5
MALCQSIGAMPVNKKSLKIRNNYFKITEPSSLRPPYCTTRSLDDITLYWYDSDNEVIERRVPWFQSTFGTLLDATIDEYNFQQFQQKRFEEFRSYMNDTEGFQVLQLLDGCILYDDGSFDTLYSFHYNGEPFIRFDEKNGSWIADDPRAQVFADRYNQNKTQLNQTMNLQEIDCAQHINKLLSLGECMFTRTEQPVVTMTQTAITNSTYRLSCRAYGHYPKNISMMWYQDGEPVPENLVEIVTLPLPDITYLTWLSMNINMEDNNVYTCGVTHSSMTSPLMMRSHSRYFFTTVTPNNSASDYPFYYTTRSIDDITLYWYDSDTGVVERRVPWFRSVHNGLLEATITEHNFQISLSKVLESFRNHVNDTEGFHVLQLLEGCILHDNQTIYTLLSYRYDGNPLMSFNSEKSNWTAEDPRAQYLADINNMNQTVTEDIKNSLVNQCILHIAELLSLGNCTFNRKEEPVVVVTKTPITNTVYKMHCRAYGHYPKNISMIWNKNGEPVPDSMMEKVTLPLPDITYLTRLTMNITSTDDNVYTCRVTHSSLMSPLMARLSEDLSDLSNSSSDNNARGSGISIGGIIGICLAIILLMVFIVFGFVCWANSRRR